MPEASRHPVMDRVQERFTQSGLTLDALGQKMGYPAESAKKSAWQFIHGTNDPRVSMLDKFCKAVEVSLAALFKGL